MKPQVKARRQQARTFFDRKVRQEGYTRSLSLGKIIPKGWQYVRIRIIDKTGNIIILRIDKLLGEETIAQNTKTNTRRKQNT